MHIKNIHCIIEKLAETTKVELDKGIENVDTKEMGEVADIIKDLAEAEYYAKISKAMDEAEYGEDYDYMGAYDEHERKGYRGQRRDSRGRYMSRRGYESRMMPEMRWDDMEYERDIDRPYGRMGYSGSNTTSGSSMSGNANMGYSESNGGQYSSRMQRDSREGRSGQMRRGYIEAKEKGADKQQKMKELEDYMKELSSDVTEMIGDASPEEKAMLKNKMQVLMQKIQ